MRRGSGFRTVLGSIVAVGIATMCAAGAQAFSWGASYIPDVPVVDQNGKSLRFYKDLVKGKIVVVSFFYTSCHDICPLVTARLAQARDKIKARAGRDIFFVSISMDPVHDTPERLQAYASAFGADAGWSFVTGQKDDVDQIRHKLGERSRRLNEHANTILFYNDTTGEWSKDSALSDLNVLAVNIRSMDPAWRSAGLQHDSGALSGSGSERPGQSLFIKACAGCHTIGNGAKVGPDLIDLARRRTSDWAIRYMIDPGAMRSQGDRDALDLVARFPAMRMPNLSLSKEDASDLIGYITAMSYAAKDDGAPMAHMKHGGHEP